MEMALTFNDVTLTPVHHENSLWIRAAELARALGYSSEKSVSNIYKRNQDEFSNEMSVVINLMTTGTPVPTRIFSPRGCHLISMLARTKVAKEFRKWVLNILDKLAEEERTRACATASHLPPSDRAELKALVDAKLSTHRASVQGKVRSEIWTRFNRHFQIAEYAQLPQAKMPEARDYLIGLEVRALQSLPPAPAPATPALDVEHLPKAMPATRKELLKRINRLSIEARQGFSYARDLIRLNCHPGVLSMKMNYEEREVWHLLESLQQSADESLAAAYNAVSAGYRLGLLVGRE